MHPPYLRITQALRHFRRCKARNPQTCACILLPKIKDPPWAKDLDKMRLMEEFDKGSTPLLHSDTSEQEVPLHTPLQIWFEGPGLPGPPPVQCSMQPTHMCFDVCLNDLCKTAMFDTGATSVYISKYLAKQLRMPTKKTHVQIQIADKTYTNALTTAGSFNVKIHDISFLI